MHLLINQEVFKLCQLPLDYTFNYHKLHLPKAENYSKTNIFLFHSPLQAHRCLNANYTKYCLLLCSFIFQKLIFQVWKFNVFKNILHKCSSKNYFNNLTFFTLPRWAVLNLLAPQDGWAVCCRSMGWMQHGVGLQVKFGVLAWPHATD